MDNRKIQIFKVGTHKPMTGAARSFSVTDLDNIVAKNNGREVPLVVGHPKIDDPAYGWANEFSREGDVLFASVATIDTEFEQLVNDGKFKNVSISLRSDNTIRHIGFLGAAAPAVQGLKPAQFADGDEGECFSFGEDEAPPATDSESQPPATDPEPEPKKLEDPTLVRIQQLEAKITALEKEKEEKLASEKKAEFAAFAEAQVTEGRIKPDQKEKVVSVLEFLHTNDSGEMAFSDAEPEGATAFKELIESLPKIITSGRIKGMEFAEPVNNVKICKTPTELAAIISETMENN